MDRIPSGNSRSGMEPEPKRNKEDSEKKAFSYRKGQETDANPFKINQEQTGKNSERKTLREHYVEQLNYSYDQSPNSELTGDSDGESSGIEADRLPDLSPTDQSDERDESRFWDSSDSEESYSASSNTSPHPHSLEDSEDDIVFLSSDNELSDEGVLLSSDQSSTEKMGVNHRRHIDEYNSESDDKEYPLKANHKAQNTLPEDDTKSSPLKPKLSLGSIPSASDIQTEEIVSGKDVDFEETAERLKVIRHISQENNKKWVTRSRSIPTDEEYALEVFEADQLEAELLDSITSPNIIGFFGFEAIETQKEYYTTLCMQDGGINAADAAKKMEGAPSIESLKLWAEDLAKGLECLKKNKIMHRDIKPKNLLIHPEDNHLRIADLGNAIRIKDCFPKDATGSGMYAAPETLRGETQGFEADIYSAGMSLISIFMDAGLIDLVSWSEFYSLRKNKAPIPLKPDYKHNLAATTLVETSQRMTNEDSKLRPGAEEVVQIFSVLGRNF